MNDLVNEKAIFVLNKSDLGVKNLNPKLKKLNPILISLKNEKNIEELISAIKLKLKNKFITSDDILITRERHRQHLEQCVEHLEKFENKNNAEDFDKAVSYTHLTLPTTPYV